MAQLDKNPLGAYQYTPLRNENAFRYLILQPCRRGDPIACSLVQSDFNDTIAGYEAVSYVWGSSVQDCEILCDDRVLKITANLFEVLQNFRLPDRSRALWADSICINQNDPKERSQQVAVMGKIYSSADQVLVHLGVDDEGQAELARTLMEDVGAMIEADIKRLEKPIPWDAYPTYDANGPLVSDTRWHAMSKLSWQPWFRRGWVVQEAALARNVKMFWNRTELDWHKLLIMAFWLIYKAPLQIAGNHDIHSLNAHMDQYYTRHEYIARAFVSGPTASRSTLIDCLNQSRNLEVTDSRDRIYAMIHLPSQDPESHYVPRIDYGKSVEEVCRDFAVNHVQHTKTIEVLDYVTHTATTVQRNWSWVPMWHRAVETNWPLQINRHLEQARLQPRFGHTVDPVVIENNVLRARGVMFDSVVFSSETLHGDNPPLPRVYMTSMLQRIWNTIDSTSQCPYESGRRLEAFLRVVIMDIFQGGISWFQSAATIYLDLAKTSNHPDAIKTPPWVSQSTPTEPDLFYLRAIGTLYMRRVILTNRGYIGLAPLETRKGDICAIVFGCGIPCILRKADVEGKYRYVGSVYMPGKSMTGSLDDDGEWYIANANILGTEKSKDWVEWDDVNEQDIDLC